MTCNNLIIRMVKRIMHSSLNLIIGSFVALNILIQDNPDKLTRITIAYQTIKN